MVVSTNIETVTLTGDERVRRKIYTAVRDRELPYNEKRPGILVLPGGGYSFCSNRDGDPIALAFLAAGYNAFVLEYSTLSSTEKRFPA